MICDKIHNPPSNQMQLPIGGKGESWMQEAREWCAENPAAWQRFLDIARADSIGGYASAKSVAWEVRAALKVGINDKLVSSLARLAVETDDTIKFKFKRSSVDGFTTATLK